MFAYKLLLQNVIFYIFIYLVSIPIRDRTEWGTCTESVMVLIIPYYYRTKYILKLGRTCTEFQHWLSFGVFYF